MTFDRARVWLVSRSLLMIGVFAAFFILAPATRFPLHFDQSLAILQIIFPLFLGYLSSAVIFITKQDVSDVGQKMSELLAVLIVCPFYVTIFLGFVLVLAFGLSNWPTLERAGGGGMPFDTMSTLISLVLGIHTATTSGLVAYLFKQEK
jgi:hypothetical protein